MKMSKYYNIAWEKTRAGGKQANHDKENSGGNA